MKVALVNSSNRLPVPPVLGGPIENTLYETALSIREPQLKVVSAWSPSLAEYQAFPKDIFYHIDVQDQRNQIRRILGRRLNTMVKNPVQESQLYYLSGVTDWLRQINPDVIQLHNRPEYLPYLVRQFPGKCFVSYMHEEPGDKIYALMQKQRIERKVHHAVFVSHYLARRFRERIPIAQSKTSVIHNSIDLDVWHSGLKLHKETKEIRDKYELKPERTLLFVGRIVPRKGLHCLLASLEYICSKLPDIKLLVVGSPLYGARAKDDYGKKMRKWAQRIGPMVTFTGYVPHDQMPYFFAASDVVVVPSVASEGHPKTVLEALASGVPVVASRQGGIPETLKDGVDGRLVKDPKDAKTLADCILEILQNSNLRQKMERAAEKKAADQFSKPIRLQRVRAFYEALQSEFHLAETNST